MAKKISDMTLAAAAALANELEINEAGTTKKITLTQLQTLLEANITSFLKALTIDSNAANTSAILTLENTAGQFQIFRVDAAPEGVITGSPGDIAIWAVDGVVGRMFFKVTGDATNTGWRRMIPEIPVFRSGTMTTQGIGTGIFYSAGHYNFATADANLTQAAQTQVFGVANEPVGGHAAIVAAAAGTASGGAGAVEIEVSGTSIDETGSRTEADTEILVADITTMSTDEYFETTKKWIGQVTFTLQNAGGSTQTTFAADFNYGHLKYTDMGDRDFTITDFKADGLAGANDSDFGLRLLKHSSTGWTYTASGFVPGNGVIASLVTDYSTESDLANGENFAYDRTGLTTTITGSDAEGYIVEITTGQNNAIEYLNFSVGVIFD